MKTHEFEHPRAALCLLLACLALALLLAACGGAEPTPTPAPTATPAPIATAIPIPTATPQIVGELPEGCLGWLGLLQNVIYLCKQENKTVLYMTDGQCAVVHTDVAALKIHYESRNGDVGQAVKKPGENLCAAGGAAMFQIWVSEPTDLE